jgi:3-oxoacyl-[acyl-carrier protein] reductase
VNEVIFNFSGRTVLVTGASRGIGSAIARLFLKSHATVIGTYHNGQGALEGMMQEHPYRAHAFQLSLEDAGSVRRVAQTVTKDFGGADILVNNAGEGHTKDFLEYTEKEILRSFQVNHHGPMALCRLFLPYMLESGDGRIVNIISRGAETGGRDQPPYAAAKAALWADTKALTRLYVSKGVYSFPVSPGFVDTEMLAQVSSGESAQKDMSEIPIGRKGTPEEVAGVVAFLCTDYGKYMSGQMQRLYGGEMLS